MRVAFFGNSPGYSEQFAAALVRRSNDSSDPVTLVAIVCPQRHISQRRARLFPVIVTMTRLVGSLIGSRMQKRLLGQRGGIYLALTHYASQARVPVLYPASLDEVLDPLAELRPDLCIVAGLNRILRPDVIDLLPPVYNIHPSLLPEYRGGTPEFWQLADGVERGGVTLHRIDRGIDTGPIVLQRAFSILPWIDIAELGELSLGTGLALLNEFLDGCPEVAKQSLEQTGRGSYRPIPKDTDRIAPFASDAHTVFNRARAYGWATPLIVHVERSAWNTGGELIARDRGESTLELQLYDPVPFDGQTVDPPGTVRRMRNGGATLACRAGTVLFHRVRVA